VGGGDTAVKEALYLSDIASKVYLIHRREGFRANPRAMERLLAKDNIELKLNQVVSNISGTTLMNKVRLNHLVSGQQEDLEIEGLFVSIGMVAAGQLAEGLVETRDGYIVTDAHGQTSAEGIFAAGDICAKEFRQVATAVGDGCIAGMAVTEYLKDL
jgi:thioredoxin reductase (NADPH)